MCSYTVSVLIYVLHLGNFSPVFVTFRPLDSCIAANNCMLMGANLFCVYV